MVSSPNYDRLKNFRELNFDTSTTEENYQKAHQKLNECESGLQAFRSNPGLSGETWNAASEWLSRYETDLNNLRDELQVVKSRYDAARAVMNTAKGQADNVSDVLVSSAEAGMWSGESEVEVNGTTMTGDQYIDYLREERNREREERSAQILDTMNNGVNDHATNIRLPIKQYDGVDTGEKGGGSQQPSGGRPTSGYPGGPTGGAPGIPKSGPRTNPGDWKYTQPVIGGSPERRYGSPVTWVPYPETDFPPRPVEVPIDGGYPNPPYDRPRPYNPITGQPIQRPGDFPHYTDVPYTEHVVNPDWTSDGPVGGYTPPSVTNANDPRWSPSFGAGRDVPSSTVAGGVLGLGGAGAAGVAGRVSGATGRGPAGGTIPTRAGGAPTGRVPSGGLIGATGTTGAAAGGKAPTASRGQAGAGGRGGMMGMAPGATGQGSTGGRSGSARGGRAGGVRGGSNVIGGRGAGAASGARPGASPAGARGGMMGMAPGAAGQQGQGNAKGGKAAGRGASAARGGAAGRVAPGVGRGGAPAGAGTGSAGARGMAAGVAPAGAQQGQGGKGNGAGRGANGAARGGNAAGRAGAGAGARGVVPMGGRSGRKGDEKDKEITLVGYDVDRLEDIEEKNFDESQWAGGSADKLTPLPDKDSGDTW